MCIALLSALASVLIGLGACSRTAPAEVSADTRMAGLLNRLVEPNQGEPPQDLFALLPGFAMQAERASDPTDVPGLNREELDRLLADAAALASCTTFSGAPDSTIEPLTRVDLGPSGMRSDGTTITFESFRSLAIAADTILAASADERDGADEVPFGCALVRVGLLLDDNCHSYIAVVAATKLLLMDRGIKVLESQSAAMTEEDRKIVREMREVLDELGELFKQHHTSD